MQLRLPRWSLACALLLSVAWAAEPSQRASTVKVTVLSTMLADGDELGEWGFAALVEVDGRRILFDTGAKADVVSRNVRTLGLSLQDVHDVVLSHWHSDHVGGLMTLRREWMALAADALGRTHVGEGIFASRRGVPARVELNPLVWVRPEYEATGGVFVEHARPVQLYPGVWLTGPVPRRHPERNWSGRTQVVTPTGSVEDTIRDDLSLVIDTDEGLVVISGCGHAGVINLLEHARDFLRPSRVHALIGGIHLFNASEESLAWTSAKLRAIGVDHLIGAHCTGIETVYRFRQDLGLERERCVVGATGASFELGRGIKPGVIAK